MKKAVILIIILLTLTNRICYGDKISFLDIDEKYPAYKEYHIFII